MACSCHKERITDTPAPVERTKPADQCIWCAQKHFATALGAFREYTYSAENRTWILAQLQAAIGHTYKDYTMVADALREASRAIQDARDAEIDFDAITGLIHLKILEEHPEIKGRLDELEAQHG